MLYHIVPARDDERIAVMAAVLVGFLSFNTVYASTQASDAMCTVLVVATVLCLQQGERLQRTLYFAPGGLLALGGVSVSAEPGAPAAVHRGRISAVPRARPRFGHADGGVPRDLRGRRRAVDRSQLPLYRPLHSRQHAWRRATVVRHAADGTLSRELALQSRAAFEFPPVDYTSIDELPLVITGESFRLLRPAAGAGDLVYWTNRDRRRSACTATVGKNGDVTALVPAQPSPTAVDYYFETPPIPMGDNGRSSSAATTLATSKSTVMRSTCSTSCACSGTWPGRKPLEPGERDFDHDGRVTEADLRHAAALIVDDQGRARERGRSGLEGLVRRQRSSEVQFVDGSTLTVDRRWTGKITDLRLGTPIVDSKVAMLMNRSRVAVRDKARRGLAGGRALARPSSTWPRIACRTAACRTSCGVSRRSPGTTFATIRGRIWSRRPDARFACSSLPAVRTSARRINSAAPGAVYAIGRIVSLSFFALLIAGVWLARARGFRLFLMLAPIVYVPLTICFMLINARYSMTMQPFVFAFVAVSMVTALDALRPGPARPLFNRIDRQRQHDDGEREEVAELANVDHRIGQQQIADRGRAQMSANRSSIVRTRRAAQIQNTL
jgi:hypothetical protein